MIALEVGDLFYGKLRIMDPLWSSNYDELYYIKAWV